jgi:predicted nuclease of restriction endonuclease-like (RecB) superfamily
VKVCLFAKIRRGTKLLIDFYTFTRYIGKFNLLGTRIGSKIISTETGFLRYKVSKRTLAGGKTMKKDKSTGNRNALATKNQLGLMDYAALLGAIEQVHQTAQRQAAQTVDLALTLRNWLIGYYTFEYEQRGSDRAKYGAQLLENLAHDLTKRLGRGFSRRTLFTFRQFYLQYPIVQTLFAQLDFFLPSQPTINATRLDWQDDSYFRRVFTETTWAHLIELSRIDDPLKRAFYEIETLNNRWSVRELKRQIASLLYERIGLSRDKKGVLLLAKQGELVATPAEMIRDPYVFEFLGLKREELYTESQLERALLDHLQGFLLELGKGFCFIGRQRRVTIDNDHYYIDLLLYNRRLKCLVAIDLILGPFKHQYAGAMNFYLNYLKAEEMEKDENPPIGIVLCSDKNETHVEYALGGLSNKIFVSRYLLNLPSEKELQAFIQRTRRKLER